jgi:hypothetical protein
MPFNVLSKKYIGKIVISTLLVTTSFGVGFVNKEPVAYGAGSGTITAYTVPTVSANASSEALGTIRFTVPNGAFSGGDITVLSLPHGFHLPTVNNNIDFYQGVSTVTSTTYGDNYIYSTSFDADTTNHIQIQVLSDNEIKLTMPQTVHQSDYTSDPYFNVNLGNVVANGASNGPVNVSVSTPNNSSFPAGSVTVGNVIDSTGTSSTGSTTEPSSNGGGGGTPTGNTLSVTTVPSLTVGYNGEAIKLLIKSDTTFITSSPFTVTLPNGVIWNNSYTTDGTVTGATYHRTSDNSLQFTVSGSPYEITIPLDVQINSASNGALNANVSAPSSSNIPNGNVTFANVVPDPNGVNQNPIATGGGDWGLILGENPLLTFNAGNLAADQDGDALIITNVVDSHSGVVNWSIDSNNVLNITPLAEGTTTLTTTISDERGGEVNVPININVKSPILLSPKVNTVTTTDKVVTGTAQAGTTITVKSQNSILGQARTGTNGSFSVNIPSQQTGTVLTVIATDQAGNVSQTTSVTVIQDECFIATASFGSKFEPSVVILRMFRDRHLMSNSYGQSFVKFYYRHSPPIARNIAGSELKKGIVRLVLSPLVYVAKTILKKAK